jgi:hypothetical protein
MRILSPADFRTTPWKNGLGETTEIARSELPGPRGVFDFAWRISVATVAADGPFSTFEGIERTITVVEGAGMELLLADGTLHRLLPFEPFIYDGGMAITGRLIDGAVRDFNVMVRRGRWRAAFRMVDREQRIAATTPGAVMVAYAVSGCWAIADDRTSLSLPAGSAAIAEEERPLSVVPTAPGRLAVAVLTPVTGAAPASDPASSISSSA